MFVAARFLGSGAAEGTAAHSRVASLRATVLGLREGVQGIPHVLFKIAIECSDANCFEDHSRILALESFLDTYPEHVQ